MDEVITREHYQAKRLEFVRSILDLTPCSGLEIGACDLPSIPKYLGACEFADFRTAEEMIELWKLSPETVVPVTYLLNREDLVSSQVDKRFDYVIACHVIEHIPNPIGYIQDLQKLLDPREGGIIILAVPDKRHTADVSRSSTRLEHLLMDHHDNCRAPTMEHVMEFSRAWSPELAAMSERSTLEYYNWATAYLASGHADAHCHVWTDEEFFRQMERLAADGLFPDLEIFATQLTQPGFNEFMIAFRALPART
ncbi:methyltransferase domain-containing protein [Methylosinus sp. LW4]|uniref:methyltransferase domain-containing protein n=1 Tax=Methylosinus sp. LW4 TaxID=136993 RepID=UPI0012F9848B|nr:methyltransferase domain-containing protein [Methylosinus sp. LW4]